MSEVNKDEFDAHAEAGVKLIEWIRAFPDKKDLEAMVMTLAVISNSSASLDTSSKDFAAASNWANLLHENLTILHLLYQGLVCVKADEEGHIVITESPAGEKMRKHVQSTIKSETPPEPSDN